jgi:hypothetical protein
MPRLSYVICGLLAAALAGTVSAQQQASFGSSDDNAFAAQLWQALVSAKLAGPGAMQSKPHPGQHPHGAVSQTFYASVPVAGQSGAVIVKRDYGGSGVGSQAVAQDPDKFLQSIAVMYQRPGYATNSHGWFWVSYLPTGVPAKNTQGVALAGRIGGGDPNSDCIGCHRAAAGNDLVFSQ